MRSDSTGNDCADRAMVRQLAFASIAVPSAFGIGLIVVAIFLLAVVLAMRGGDSGATTALAIGGFGGIFLLCCVVQTAQLLLFGSRAAAALDGERVGDPADVGPTLRPVGTPTPLDLRRADPFRNRHR